SGAAASLPVPGRAAAAPTTTASLSLLDALPICFSVTVGTADHLTFTGSNANVAAGSTKTLTAEVRDAAGNLETADNSTVVTFAKTAGPGTVGGLDTATASGGVASLTLTRQTVGA